MVIVMSATAVPARGKQTRERILEAAERAVLQKGFKSTSIEEIAVAAGSTRNGLSIISPTRTRSPRPCWSATSHMTTRLYENGRASCRERVCTSGKISGGGVQ